MQNSTRTDQSYLGTAKIGKLVLKFSIPCVLSLLVSALYNIVDQIFIGNSELSTLGNAATGIVFPIFIIAQAFAWWLGDGCATHLNICQGRNDDENIHKTVGACTSLTLIISLVLISVFFPLKTQILTLFGATENSIAYAAEYFNIILAFFPLFMIANMLQGVIRADGSPTFAMISMLSGAVVNIALDLAFIYGCKWGMSGAAWATAIGQTVSFVLAAVYFVKPKTFKLRINSFIPRFKDMAPALKLGASSFITQMTIVVISLVCNIMLGKYGALSRFGADIPIAVIGIESKVFTVVVNLVVGVVLGCQPIIGYNLGAENFGRVRKLYLTVLLYTVFIGLVSTLIFELAPRGVVGIFGSPQNLPEGVTATDYWDFSVLTFRIFLMLVTLTLFIKMNSIFFQAVGKPVQAIIASLIRDIVVFLPLVTTLPLAFGIEGVLYAAPISDAIGAVVATTLTVFYFVSIRKREKEKHLSMTESTINSGAIN